MDATLDLVKQFIRDMWKGVLLIGTIYAVGFIFAIGFYSGLQTATKIFGPWHVEMNTTVRREK